jgi:hypothetical protein
MAGRERKISSKPFCNSAGRQANFETEFLGVNFDDWEKKYGVSSSLPCSSLKPDPDFWLFYAKLAQQAQADSNPHIDGMRHS